jgi:hypothetical protein
MSLQNYFAMCYCGKRRGLHRYGDECCPNPRWVAGNGEDQWWTHRSFVALPEPTNGLDGCTGKAYKGAAPTVIQTAGATSQTTVG